MNTVYCMDCITELHTNLDVGERRVICKRCKDLRLKGNAMSQARQRREKGLRHCDVCCQDKPLDQFQPSKRWHKSKTYVSRTCLACAEISDKPAQTIGTGSRAKLYIPAHWRI